MNQLRTLLTFLIAMLFVQFIPQFASAQTEATDDDIKIMDAVSPVYLEIPDETPFSISQVQDVEISPEGDVYALGYAKQAGSNIEEPVFWKNGKKQELFMPENSTWAKAFNLGIEKDEQIILGYHNDTTGTADANYYCYWRNEKYYEFDHSFAAVASKIVDGNVYVIGYKSVYDEKIGQWIYQGVYYVNDKEYQLTIPKNLGYHSSVPATISVANGKVYVAGTVLTYNKAWDSVIKQHTALWTNGTCMVAPPVAPKYNYSAMEINTQGNKPELVGTYYYYTDKAKYQYATGYFTWQPGSPLKQMDIPAPTAAELKQALGDVYETEGYCTACYSATSFFIDNKQQWHALLDVNNLYTVYMLNGKIKPLPVTAGNFGSLTVRDGKAYIGGSYADAEGNKKACYWLDGKMVELE